MSQRAETDALTGLGNHGAFQRGAEPAHRRLAPTATTRQARAWRC